MSTGASFARGSSKQDYSTPAVFIEAVKAKFSVARFDWDLAAHPSNAKAPRFFTEEEDAFSHRWDRECSGDCWLNPPFEGIPRWAKKCADTAFSSSRIFLLVPASVGSNWFAQHIYPHAHVAVLNGRITFDGMPVNPKTGKVDPYPKDCMLCVYGMAPGFEIWRWK